MTTAELPPEWLPTSAACRVLGVCHQNVRKHFAAGRFHAHHSGAKAPERIGSRAGEWLIRDVVARAARRGASLETQRALCGCESAAWSPPPMRLGRGRRRPIAA